MNACEAIIIRDRADMLAHLFAVHAEHDFNWTVFGGWKWAYCRTCRKDLFWGEKL